MSCKDWSRNLSLPIDRVPVEIVPSSDRLRLHRLRLAWACEGLEQFRLQVIDLEEKCFGFRDRFRLRGGRVRWQKNQQHQHAMGFSKKDPRLVSRTEACGSESRTPVSIVRYLVLVDERKH